MIHIIMPSAEYMRKRRKAMKKRLISLLGGKCIECGSKKDLEFDHTNPTEKGFDISDALDAAFSRLEPEINKCRLLCKKCHLSKTLKNFEHNIWGPARHGTIYYYKQLKCRCDECKQAMSAYYHSHKKMPD